jgi:fumarate hydratase class II
MPSGNTRTESDSMGPMQVPAEALWGASTARAVENFRVSGWPMPPRVIHALGAIKREAARVNGSLGLLEASVAEAVAAAADAVAQGTHDGQFPVDVFQTGSGTSTNMNANEVIATLASARLGGGHRVHPNDHVNLGQSSNDVIPTAIHLAAADALGAALLIALHDLEVALADKAWAFRDVLKTARTHLQDAVPVRLGQVFGGYAAEVALGGTAVGTGLNTHPEFAARVCVRLTEATGLEVREAVDHFAAQGTLDGIVAASAALRGAALSLGKIARDVAWLASGPRAGLGEITLPAVQPGSSIMPGKVNPVMAESLLQACAHVTGADAAVAACAPWARFELAAMLPVAGWHLVTGIEVLAAATTGFADRCVKGIEATAGGPDKVERGLALATALAPVLGYDKAAAIAKAAAESGRTVRETAREMSELSEEDLTRLLDPARMTGPGLPDREGPGGEGPETAP